MALPWLIGAAVVAVGGAVIAAIADDDNDSGYRDYEGNSLTGTRRVINDSGYRDYEEDDREEQQREKSKKDLKAYTRRQVNSLAKHYGIGDKNTLKNILQGTSLDSLEALWRESEFYKEKEKELEQKLTQLDTLNQAAKALEKL